MNTLLRFRETGFHRPALLRSAVGRQRMRSMALSRACELASPFASTVTALALDEVDAEYLLAASADTQISIYDVGTLKGTYYQTIEPVETVRRNDPQGHQARPFARAPVLYKCVRVWVRRWPIASIIFAYACFPVPPPLVCDLIGCLVPNRHRGVSHRCHGWRGQSLGLQLSRGRLPVRGGLRLWRTLAAICSVMKGYVLFLTPSPSSFFLISPPPSLPVQV